MADSGSFRYKNQSYSEDNIGLKYIDMAAFSISNTILKILCYLPPQDKKYKKKMII